MKKLDLHLFEGDGGATGSASGEGAMASAESHEAGGNSDVLTTSSTLEDRSKAFDDMIKGEYKDEFNKRTQKIIDRRFKQTKELQARVDASQPIMDLLSQRYGVSDPAELMSAIESDTTYWQEVADEAGMTVEQYKEFSRLKAENEKFYAEQQNRLEREQAKERAEKWYLESEALERKYPQFDLTEELNNPNFVAMIQNNVPMEDAYKVLHLDEINQQIQMATEKAVTENIRAKGNRPQENGVSSQSATTIKKNVSALSKKDRADIAQRVARGEMISF